MHLPITSGMEQNGDAPVAVEEEVAIGENLPKEGSIQEKAPGERDELFDP